MTAVDASNGARFDPSDRGGHYESWFLRANHPVLPLAFWIRYTIFAPRSPNGAAQGELWAIYFDGAADRIEAAYEPFSIDRCRFAGDRLEVEIDGAELDHEAASGRVGAIAWDLRYTGRETPLYLLPQWAYRAAFPKAKSLVPRPGCTFEGSLEVAGKEVVIDGWRGSQNHNWGRRHTDRYAWGQVVGFDEDPSAFFECATARVKIGPLWTPWVTMMVLEVDGATHRTASLLAGARARARFDGLSWRVDAPLGDARVRFSIDAPRPSFVALPYRNPPGGTKTCLNTKVARCELNLERPGRTPLRLHTDHRSAFELLTDGERHGVRSFSV